MYLKFYCTCIRLSATKINHNHTVEYRRLEDDYGLILKTFLFFVTYFLVGCICFSLAETWNFGDCMWFMMITIVTIGYGDLVPRTSAGKSINVVNILGMIAVV